LANAVASPYGEPLSSRQQAGGYSVEFSIKGERGRAKASETLMRGGE